MVYLTIWTLDYCFCSSTHHNSKKIITSSSPTSHSVAACIRYTQQPPLFPRQPHHLPPRPRPQHSPRVFSRNVASYQLINLPAIHRNALNAELKVSRRVPAKHYGIDLDNTSNQHWRGRTKQRNRRGRARGRRRGGGQR